VHGGHGDVAAVRQAHGHVRGVQGFFSEVQLEGQLPAEK
jgi:hypothetical protein